eukprot:CAMPEP_0115023076 /NCGR_PEP_ID=MMETSP0216-20121206/32102_1 /TAXON_ID=223996 /ORGANISM="Protocruzia adherens, Strain Boccale" /LENGTH=151 /DNA_ID=CAMNT_0002396225 /DNA_START=1 /DNA_END=456 /DNA_ORIENTATION=-
MDISDPVEAGPGWLLYTKEFYTEAAENFLTEDGILVTQSTSVFDDGREFSIIHNTLKQAFNQVVPYFSIMIESFGGPWGFNMATNSKNLTLLNKNTDPEDIDKRVEERVGQKLKEYDGITHLSMTNLPKSVRRQFNAETEVITKATPRFII